jgi:hypothetical protein
LCCEPEILTEPANHDPKNDPAQPAGERARALWPCFVCRAPGACPHREADLLLWMLRRPPGRETRGAVRKERAR